MLEDVALARTEHSVILWLAVGCCFFIRRNACSRVAYHF